MPEETPATGNQNPAAETAKAETTGGTYQPKPDDATVAQADNPDAVKNALNAERKAARDARKERDDLAARVREFEDKDASEVEKLTKRAERAEQQRKDAESRLLRFEVASEKQVPQNLVPLLTGSTKEELETQAQLLLDNLNAQQKTDFDGGAREPAETKTPEQAHNELVTQLFGARQAP